MPEIPRLIEELKKIQETAPLEERSNIGEEEELALRDRLDCDRMEAEIEGIRQDTRERKNYASKTFKLIIWWLVGVFFILLFQGLFNESQTSLRVCDFELKIKFNLSQGVLLAVVGGTTASVIGIFIVVVNYLFPKR